MLGRIDRVDDYFSKCVFDGEMADHQPALGEEPELVAIGQRNKGHRCIKERRREPHQAVEIRILAGIDRFEGLNRLTAHAVRHALSGVSFGRYGHRLS